MKKNNSAVTRWSEINIFLFFTHWLLELFAKNVFLGIMDIFSLDMGQISSNLLEKASATWQHTSCLSFHKHCILGHFYLGMGRNQNLEKVTYLFRLFIFFAMGCSRKNPCPPLPTNWWDFGNSCRKGVKDYQWGLNLRNSSAGVISTDSSRDLNA